MDVNIFIRSYRGDLKWLQYSLKSISTFLTGYNKIVVAVPYADVALFRDAGINVVGCMDMDDGYVGQQNTKMHADTFFAKPCYIMMVDSDCIFTKPTDVKELFDASTGKPYFLYTPYAVLGNAVPWHPITVKALDMPVENEFMRRQPLIFRAEELQALRYWFSAYRNITVENYIRRVVNREFSEFNVIGAWIYKFHNNDYTWINTATEHFTPIALTQYWSWGGVEKHSAEIENILK